MRVIRDDINHGLAVGDDWGGATPATHQWNLVLHL